MKGRSESWLIRTSFYDCYVFLWHSLDVVDIQRAVLPHDAALEVDDWGHDRRAHRTLSDIYRTLHGPGLLRDDAGVSVPLDVLLERLRRGFVVEELILVKVPLATPGLSPPTLPPIKPPPIKPPPKEKSWIKVRVMHADGAPVVGRDYALTLPGGQVREGTLRDRWDPEKRRRDNTIDVGSVAPGTASIRFPWKADPVQPGTQPTRPITTDGWIKLRLVEREGDETVPITDGTYSLTLPDGTVLTGSPDEDGNVEAKGFEPGVCKLSFTRDAPKTSG